MSVRSSTCALVFFKAACHANPGTEKKKFTESNSYISIHKFRKFSNTSAKNNAAL